MHSNYRTNLVYFCVTACTTLANANANPATVVNVDPADAATPTPPLIYRSPLAEYRALGPDKSVVWQDANDTVTKIGGWREYAREAAAAMKAREAGNARPPAKAIDSSKPVPPPAPVHKHGG